MSICISESPVNLNFAVSIPVSDSLSKNSDQKISIAKRVWEVVKRVLPEFVLSLTLNIGAMVFFATPMSIPLMNVAMIGSLALGCIFAARDLARKKQLSDQTENQLQTVQVLSRGSIVNTVGLSGPNIWIHEGGHALAATAFFKNARAKIWVKPFHGGSTSYTASNRLTWLGSFLGKHSAMMVTAAAGLIASTVFAMCELGIAHKCQDNHPTLSQYLNLHAITYLFHEAMYGLSAFIASKQDLGHDLVRLWQVGGVHPLIPVVAIVALPLLQVGLMKLFDK